MIATFRQHFVKSGYIESEYGQIYGRVMNDRHSGDYDVEFSVGSERAQADLADARRFVRRVERYLQEEGRL